MRTAFFPSPLVGAERAELALGWTRRVASRTGKGSVSADRDPSSGASRHLLPQGEKEESGTDSNFQTSRGYTFAFSRRDAPEVCISFTPLEKKGAGKAGRRLHPRSCTKSARVDHRFNRIIRLSPRDGLRLIRAHPGDRAFLPPSLHGLTIYRTPGWAGQISAKLDASVGASGRHDFAVRACLAKALAGPRTNPASFVEDNFKRRSSVRRPIAHGVHPPCNPLRARRCRVHRIPPRVRDVRNAPRRVRRANH
jgi:hypothetical protein